MNWDSDNEAPAPAESPWLAGSISKRLSAGAKELGLDLPAPTLKLLLAYQAELLKWNNAYNLTAIRDPQESVTRHLLDSLSVLPLLNDPALAIPGPRLLDVGSGAGLPGLVLSIAKPSLRVTTLDSNGKKARFMRHIVRTFKLDNVEVIEDRVEAFQPELGFDCVVSRAFSSLNDFFDKTTHLLATGGVWVAMKGKLDAKEAADIPVDVEIRGSHRLRVPGLNEDRHAVVATLKK
ncbi:16S rRNA (guanine(527)-N(7))-methyltransferase RsmG [Stenotrophobium rhamnosiphilum]|uniref:Ribosomal RNA small subunit methyltransferase G n=1 Tax=Stenotrophobium rhamnosiphilum TaxID=2029166 RepID=A0A2T5MGD3_9GAMM|nr:16S rRNA (guanine(527)-N(7))-methyltransferase RsmG [Stenotrophobium rhamnosiphilum]PTU31626.1 16S rRNA (guanine(527)-N(7))-methyltransferase RsmG [Stenotrophobium rhamnosiphilum]